MKFANEKPGTVIGMLEPPAEIPASTLSTRTANVKAWIEAKPGAQGRAFAPRKNSAPLAVIYKVMGKMFAILSVRGVEDVILKCDPLLAAALRKDYTGVGHRSHLDRRFWISVRLDADVPTKEIRRLVSLSYDLVCANLSAKQRTELARLAPTENVMHRNPPATSPERPRPSPRQRASPRSA
jgi:predicted DNA-binding protein (MmcQ/YjbR family)